MFKFVIDINFVNSFTHNFTSILRSFLYVKYERSMFTLKVLFRLTLKYLEFTLVKIKKKLTDLSISRFTKFLTTPYNKI